MKLKYRNAAHYIAGILVALSYLVHPVLSIVGFVTFIIYELNEDWHIRDKAYHDILEFAIGFFVAVTGLIIWRFVYG